MGQKNFFRAINLACAVERDALSDRRRSTRPGHVHLPKIISNNSYAHDEQGNNPGQEKRGFDGVLYKL